MGPVPVFMYHHVNQHKGDMVTVTPEVFEQQMKYLHTSGYKTLKPGELLSYIKGDTVFNEKAVMITFDDGWLDNYIYAYPVLKKYGINATIFIASHWIDEASKAALPDTAQIPNHEESASLISRNEAYKVVLNWDLVKEMDDSGLIEFHSHTQNHVKCHHLSEQDLTAELTVSRQTIEEKLRRKCDFLCWPMGRYNDLTVKTAKEIGYKALFTTDLGIADKTADPFAVKRIAVKDSMAWFKKSLTIYTNSVLSKLYLAMKRK